jgi:fumarate hydratase class II
MLINPEPEFQSMFNKMLEKTKTYLQEALKCDAIILATALNPVIGYQ